MNKFEQVSSDDHQIAVTEGGRSHVWYPGEGVPCLVSQENWVGPMSGIQEGEVPMSQFIMSNGHMGPPSPSEQNEKHL